MKETSGVRVSIGSMDSAAPRKNTAPGPISARMTFPGPLKATSYARTNSPANSTEK